MHDIAVVDVRESFCSVAVFAEEWSGGALKGSATVRGSFSDITSGTASRAKEEMSRFSPSIDAVILLLPRSLFHITYLELPAKNEALLAKMMEFEVQRHFPIPADQLLYAYSIADRKDGRFGVNLAGLKRADFDAYFNAAVEAGISPDVVSVSSHALLPDTGGGKRTVVDIAPEGFEMCLADGRKIAYSRFVRFRPRLEEKLFFSGGFMADGMAGTVAEHLSAEVNHVRLVSGVESLGAYLDTIFIVGSGGSGNSILSRLSGKPDFPSASSIRLLTVGGEEDSTAATAISACAAGLYKKGATFNFIPPKMRRMRNYAVKRLLRVSLVVIAALMLVWGVAAYAVYWKTLNGLKSELASLKQSSKKGEGTFLKMEEYRSYFNSYNSFSSGKAFNLELLDALTAALPKNTYISELEFRNCEISIAGISSDASSILKSMEASPRLKNAHMLGAVQAIGQNERFKAGVECE